MNFTQPYSKLREVHLWRTSRRVYFRCIRASGNTGYVTGQSTGILAVLFDHQCNLLTLYQEAVK